MNKPKWMALAVAAALLVAAPVFAQQNAVAKKYAGALVRNSDGTIWYVSPVTLKRYPLPDASSDGFKLLKGLGLRVSASALAKISAMDGDKKPKAIKSERGRFLYTTQDRARIWYVGTDGSRRYYFDGSAGSYGFLRSLAVAIESKDFDAIPSSVKKPAAAVPAETPAPAATPNPAPAAAPNPVPAPTGAPAGPGASPGHLSAPSTAAATISGFAFMPASMAIKAGDTVTWTNHDAMAHTITADDGSFDSGPVEQNGVFSHVFAKTGTVTYHCAFHPSMHGTIVIQ